MMMGCGIEDVLSLETRTLRERMARHRAISDILRRSNPSEDDSDDDNDYDQFNKKQMSAID